MEWIGSPFRAKFSRSIANFVFGCWQPLTPHQENDLANECFDQFPRPEQLSIPPDGMQLSILARVRQLKPEVHPGRKDNCIISLYLDDPRSRPRHGQGGLCETGLLMSNRRDKGDYKMEMIGLK